MSKTLVEHGTVAGYAKSCRCAECREAIAEYNRGWRATNTALSRVPKSGHGTIGAYNNYGCRCNECKQAHAEDIRDQRSARMKAPKDPGDSRHGSASFYTNHGCRCGECKEAYRRSKS